MKQLRSLLVVTLLFMMCLSHTTHLSAQNVDPKVLGNAMDYLYNNPESWSGAKFSEPRSLQQRLYFNTGGEVGVMWNNFDNLDNRSVGANGFFRVGYQLAPVHSVEFGLLTGKMSSGDIYSGFDLAYLFDITSYAFRTEEPTRWQLFYKGALEVGFSDPQPLALSSALRVQYNFAPSLGVYLEPKIAGYLSPSSSNINANHYYRTNAFTSLSVGLSFNLDACLNTCLDSYFKGDYTFALKTNLLFDAVLAPNVELEIPIGNRWSVAGEFIFPWSTTCYGQSEDNPRNTYQLLNANVEGRYWLGDREQLPILTGWSVGLYVGGGLYDLEYQTKGYQGEFFIASGVSLGYAHLLNSSESLRMEYSLGLGYLQTDYRYYEEHFSVDDQLWHTIHKQTGCYKWFGPTRAKVSLVWLISNKTKRGGRK